MPSEMTQYSDVNGSVFHAVHMLNAVDVLWEVR